MRLSEARVVLTGASGGLGSALARQLAEAGASLLLTGRDAGRLATVALPAGCEVRRVAADLTSEEGIAALAQAARDFGADVLINNAGTGGFGLFENQAPKTVAHILATDLAAPLRLTHALLPVLRDRPAAAVVNIGSAFGSIPFAGFAAYSAAKAGLRAFSQALRRELADSPVRVIHVAPRAIDTALDPPAARALNAALSNACDRPEVVAAHVVDALRRGVAERHIGFPERLFARLNGLAPELVDRGLRGKLGVIKQHATAQHTESP
ncbi:SDR family oxidoreductase [Pseudothauera rhizosphaerae]|uniref:SDR family oxidoreductase n=1 Tax=Pseudothauera rhizosphaerae TaxID=2565932 RepID=A0A4S4AN38_9RHOO|nr:SDR family oxidoreductase [Pseudothauera rhizosphaerae]THF61030.1 SDR family oxidoreductase [Pseudothauera rhizosphaerae]